MRTTYLCSSALLFTFLLISCSTFTVRVLYESTQLISKCGIDPFITKTIQKHVLFCFVWLTSNLQYFPRFNPTWFRCWFQTSSSVLLVFTKNQPLVVKTSSSLTPVQCWSKEPLMSGGWGRGRTRLYKINQNITTTIFTTHNRNLWVKLNQQWRQFGPLQSLEDQAGPWTNTVWNGCCGVWRKK